MARTVKKRTYRSTLRSEQAARTRDAIVEAAAALFTTRGYARTTVQLVAAEAGVAADTVYAVFGSKVRLLTAVIDSRLAPPGVTNVLERPEARAVRDERDQRRQLHLYAQDLARLSTRVRPVFEVLRVAADAEPDVRSVYEQMEGHRLANMRRVAEWLAGNGPLSVDVETAARTIWAVASPDVGRLLCDVGGWSEDQHAAWIEATLAGSLLASTRGTTRARRQPG